MTKNQRLDRMMKAFGRRLRAARITNGYDDAGDFAADLAIEPPRYRKYERGDSMPPLDVLADTVKILRVDLDWLLLGISDRPGQPADSEAQ